MGSHPEIRVPLALWRQAQEALRHVLADNGWATANWRWGYQLGYEQGYDRGYEQAERDMAESWHQLAANIRAQAGAVTWCELQRRREQHPQWACQDPACPYPPAPEPMGWPHPGEWT